MDLRVRTVEYFRGIQETMEKVGMTGADTSIHSVSSEGTTKGNSSSSRSSDNNS
jgi:hypothetical protein